MEAAAVTDVDWFHQLRRDQPAEPINFWTPTGWHPEKLEPGERLFFMLKAPIRKIGGFGHFREFSTRTLKDAWDHFGTRNGVESLGALIERTRGYASTRSHSWAGADDHRIGCIVLDRPVFWEDGDFRPPEDLGFEFPKQVVTYKYVEVDEIDLTPTAQQQRETAYATEIASVTVGDTRLERLLIQESGEEEIRFSWWPGGKLAPRPLDVTEDHLLKLFEGAIAEGVFTNDFQLALLRLLVRGS